MAAREKARAVGTSRAAGRMKENERYRPHHSRAVAVPSSAEPVFLDVGGRRILAGRIIREGGHLIFCRQADPERHLHHTFGWGIDARVLRLLLRRGVTTIRIELPSGVQQVARSADYLLRGVARNYGHGDQIFLARRWWRVIDPRQLTLEGVSI